MLIHERLSKILEFVNSEENISAKELSQRLQVSEMTIWRDLKKLGAQGRILRVRGGVSKDNLSNTSPAGEPQFDAKQKVHNKEKKAIARYAAENLVGDSEIITLEGGTTVSSMVPFLFQDHLTILTNGFKTMMQALPFLSRINFMICGGILRDTSYTLVGPQAEAFFAGFRVQKFFLSGTGITPENGLTDPNPLEIQVKRAMGHSADKVILLMDSSKFGKHSLASILPLESIHILVTDQAAPQEILTQLNKTGIEIHIAGPD
jgi:DeoR/GlpR family transcriptional regulator of sugar metabolism